MRTRPGELTLEAIAMQHPVAPEQVDRDLEELLQELAHIDEALAARDRMIDGKPMPERDYRDWRRRVIHAKAKTMERYRALKEWRKRHRLSVQSQELRERLDIPQDPDEAYLLVNARAMICGWVSLGLVDLKEREHALLHAISHWIQRRDRGLTQTKRGGESDVGGNHGPLQTALPSYARGQALRERLDGTEQVALAEEGAGGRAG